MRWHTTILGGVLAVASACDGEEGRPFAEHDEDADFEPFDGSKSDGISQSFIANNILDDPFFEATTFMGVDAVQAFLEETPYNRRSFLADVNLGGQTAAQSIVAAAEAHGLNPLLLLVRLQVEKSLIGKSVAPGPKALDFAFGCGCFDGSACMESFRGFDKQLDCAATTLRKHFDAATTSSGLWKVGVGKKSLDNITVTPANSATASMYAYTPWVLVGSGGNWLVWNVSGRYLAHVHDQGLAGDVVDAGFIGTPCDPDDPEACGFASGGDEGFCHSWTHDGAPAGVCSLDCEGLCPDRGSTDTMCVELSPGLGSCAAIATEGNDHCADIPGTEPAERDRFVGGSGVGGRTAVVCIPMEDAGGPSCAGRCDSEAPIPDGSDGGCFCDERCVANGDCCPDREMVCP